MKFPTNRIAPPGLRRITLAATTALALALGSTAALAQPAGPMVGGGFGGRGGPGMHGVQGGGIDGMLPGALQQVKASLNLTDGQLLLWNKAVADGKAARDAARASHQKVKEAMTAELAKADPDLKGVAGIADAVRQQNQAARKSARDAWLDLYAALTLDQKAIVRNLLQQRLARAEAMHERMQQRWGATGN